MLDANIEEPPPDPPWLAGPRRAAGLNGTPPSLQSLLCQWLALHLHDLDSLDGLPPHLADMVSQAIKDDRSLLKDGSLGVWTASVLGVVTVIDVSLHNAAPCRVEGSCSALDTCGSALSLRWAAQLTDAGISRFTDEGWARGRRGTRTHSLPNWSEGTTPAPLVIGEMCDKQKMSLASQGG